MGIPSLGPGEPQNKWQKKSLGTDCPGCVLCSPKSCCTAPCSPQPLWVFYSPFPLHPLKPKQPSSSSRPGRAALPGGAASLRPNRSVPKAADTRSWLRGRAARRAQSPRLPLHTGTKPRDGRKPPATQPKPRNAPLPLQNQPCAWGKLEQEGCTDLDGDGAAAGCPPPCQQQLGHPTSTPSLPQGQKGLAGFGEGASPPPGCCPLAAGHMQGSGRHLPSASSKLRPVRYRVGCGSQASGLIFGRS